MICISVGLTLGPNAYMVFIVSNIMQISTNAISFIFIFLAGYFHVVYISSLYTFWQMMPYGEKLHTRGSGRILATEPCPGPEYACVMNDYVQ